MNESILLVDDEETILKSLSKNLDHLGYSITTAASGEEAVALLHEKQFCLVVTDLVMDGIDGIEVLKETKKKDPFTGVIIITGYGDMNSAIKALRLGADDYLLKPCEADEFILRLQRCIDKQDAFKRIKLYENILPVCIYCKSIRDDVLTLPGKGKWMPMEEYLTTKSGTHISHTCCPNCRERAARDMGIDK